MDKDISLFAVPPTTPSLPFIYCLPAIQALQKEKGL